MSVFAMTEDERALAARIGEPVVKMLPDGGYLCLQRQFLSSAIHRSRAGDFAGWCEEWMFENEAEAAINFALLLEGEAPIGWTRHVWLDENGESKREWARGEPCEG